MRKPLIAALAVTLLFAFGCPGPEEKPSSRPITVDCSAKTPCGAGALCIYICYVKAATPPMLRVEVTPDPFEAIKTKKATISVFYSTDDPTAVAKYLIGNFVDEGTSTARLGFGSKPEHNKFEHTFNAGKPSDQFDHTTEPAVDPGAGKLLNIKYQIEVEIQDVMKVVVDPHILISGNR